MKRNPRSDALSATPNGLAAGAGDVTANTNPSESLLEDLNDTNAASLASPRTPNYNPNSPNYPNMIPKVTLEGILDESVGGDASGLASRERSSKPGSLKKPNGVHGVQEASGGGEGGLNPMMPVLVRRERNASAGDDNESGLEPVDIGNAGDVSNTSHLSLGG